MLFLLLGLLTWRETIACPTQCNCTDVAVDCSYRGLVAFPSDLPPSAISLNLRGNSIGRISVNDVKGLEHLETLIVSENKIRSIDENLFDYLPLLRRVSFARNRLRFLPSLAAQNHVWSHSTFATTRSPPSMCRHSPTCLILSSWTWLTIDYRVFHR